MNKLKETSLIILLGSLALSANGATPFDVSAGGATRYIKVSNNIADLAQANFSINGTAKLSHNLELVGVGRTGSVFAHPWNTYLNINGENPDYSPQLTLRNIYLHGDFGNHLDFEAGYLRPDNGLAKTTNLSPFGWVDGIRMKTKWSGGYINATAGSIDDVNEVNIFDRKVEFNHYELRYGNEISKRLSFEIGGEQDDDVKFIYLGSKAVFGDKQHRNLILFGDVLADEDREVKASLTASTDLLNLITGNMGGVRMAATYQYMSEDFTRRGKSLSHPMMAATKHSGVFTFSGDVSSKAGIGWFAASKINSNNDNNLYYGGFSIRLNTLKK